MSTTNNDILKKNMINALEKSLGIVTTASKKVGIHRSTHYRWMEEDYDYKKEVESISEIALDFAESKLHEQINDNNSTSTIFYLKTKGKNRGYIERHEFTGQDGEPLNSRIDLSALKTETLADLFENGITNKSSDETKD